MTWRAVLAGLVAGAFVCAFCYFNDNVMRQTMFIGNNMPISVYGGLILFVLLINPLLKRWAFSAGELAVALPVTLALQYDRGVNHDDRWATRMVPQRAFNKAVEIQQRLTAQGSLTAAETTTGWRRFAEISANAPCLIGFGGGLAAVLAFAAIRLRWPKWPLHPVLFLVWGTVAGQMFAASFLGGWGIKVLVTQYGGASWYQRLKPLMFGLIAGELLGGLVPIAVGLVYWLKTGLPPKSFNILPG